MAETPFKTAFLKTGNKDHTRNTRGLAFSFNSNTSDDMHNRKGDARSSEEAMFAAQSLFAGQKRLFSYTNKVNAELPD